MAYRVAGGAADDRSGTRDWAVPAAPSIVPGLVSSPARTPPQRSRSVEARPSLPSCPEIDCVRSLLPASTIAFAELRAAEIGVGADRVLIAQGAISEERYLHALSAWIGLAFETMDGRTRRDCPMDDSLLAEAPAKGMLLLGTGSDTSVVVAPLVVDTRRLIKLVRSGSKLSRNLRITTTERLREYVIQHNAKEIERRAVEALRGERPDLSAARLRPNGWWLAPVAAGVLAGIAAPAAMAITIEAALGAVFFAWTALRLIGLLSKRPLPPRARTTGDASLPVYTIVVALYREVTAAEGLVRALGRLNYPKEKLQVIFALEPDDRATREALTKLMPAGYEIVVSPQGGPRTKPKALNAALPFVRGRFVAVYDAEDRPEPDQLRAAHEAFDAADPRLACVQARLTIDNTSDSWLTRMFTAEYAGLFDVLLPGLSRWRLPLPLGGSSNHFRTDVLRTVGAWDPYNVTEDADLGMRLARFGYRTTVIASTTYEEAPVEFGPWLRQRTRWCKGWLQTWLVHMRSPRRLLRDMGAAGFMVFQLLVGGTVLAALVHVLFLAEFAWGVATRPDATGSGMVRFYFVTLIAGYLISIAVGAVGLWRRGLLRHAWVLTLMPIYWLMLSFAAWRALVQLIRDPYRWEKTEHGLARTSRLAAEPQPARFHPLHHL